MKAALPPYTSASLTLLLLALLLSVCPVQPMSGVRCNPTSFQQRSCMRGCLSCWKTYGGELYDMASCCRDCTSNEAPLVDFAPSHCSLRHVQKTWLKRFG
ncbi:hypothetical protein ACOMHN_015303 [Nucella lapillus]